MSAGKTTTINGRAYDLHTGLPLGTTSHEPTSTPVREASPKVTAAHSTTVHRRIQKSKTLNRRTVLKPVPTTKTHQPVAVAQKIKHQVITKSPQISRFAPHPVVKPKKIVSDIMPRSNQLVDRAVARQQQRIDDIAPKPAAVIKEQAIAKALSAPVASSKKKRLSQRFPRVFSVASASLAVLVLAGYLTYLNMPAISVRVAAVQAGIDASYPSYKPDGYRLAGPIAYNDGHVDMQFAANAGPQTYTLVQQKSTWDSSAVLENYVKPKVGDEYMPYTEGGLTIYAFEGNAAWVNGGILYTINGNAQLSNEQIRHIATSL